MQERTTVSGQVIPDIILKIIESRGIGPDLREEFFSYRPRLAYDPFLLANMQEGVDLLLSAVDEGRKIVIYGDYDVDGITSVSLLMKVLGTLTDNLDYYIPSRLDEGYGLHRESIDRIAENGGEFIVIGARPAMGKTSFAMNIAAHASVNKGKTVAVFSLEMPREQIVMRMLCSEAKVDMQRVRKGTLTDEDWMKLARALGPISNAPLYLDDTAGLSPSQLRSRCRRLMMDHGLDLILVDYLGLMHGDGRTESRQLEVAEISRQMKAIALEMKIPVICCAQLSQQGAD